MRKLIDRHFGRETGQPHAHRPVRASGDAGGEAEAEAASALEGRIGAAYPKQKREAFDARYNEFTAATAQLHRKPLEIPLPRSQSTKREILDGLQTVKIAVSPMMRCWQDGIPAEVRAEIMTEAYELAVYPPIRTERRGHKHRWPWRIELMLRGAAEWIEEKLTPGQMGYLLEAIDWRHPQQT